MFSCVATLHLKVTIILRSSKELWSKSSLSTLKNGEMFRKMQKTYLLKCLKETLPQDLQLKVALITDSLPQKERMKMLI
jgi:hypothetical protein